MPGQIENIILPPHELAQRRRFAQIKNMNRQSLAKIGDIEMVPAIFWPQTIDQRHLRACFNEMACEVRADETQPPSNERALSYP